MKIVCLLGCLAFLFTSPLAGSPADFNAIQGYGTDIPSLTPNKNDVVLENILLTEETTHPDGRKRLSFTASLRNTGTSYFERASIYFEEPTPEWNIEIVADGAALPDLPPNGIVFTSAPLVLLAPADTAEAVKSQVLSGQRLKAKGMELFQFRLPPVAVDHATDEAFDHAVEIPFTHDVTLVFEYATPLLSSLVPGRLLMETTLTEGVARNLNGSGQLEGLAQYVSTEQRFSGEQEGKIRTTRMVEITAVSLEGDGSVKVSGIRFGGELEPFVVLFDFDAAQADRKFRGFIDNLREGTLAVTQKDAFDPSTKKGRDALDPPVGLTMFTGSETLARNIERRELLDKQKVRHARMSDLGGFFVMHLPVNDFQIVKGVMLDGEILLDGLNLSFEVRFKLGAIQRIAVTVTSKIEMNMRLTAGPGASNGDKPLIEKERQIASVPGPAIYFSIGSVPIKIQPVFQVKAGVTLDVPMQVVVPFTGSFEAGVQMIWDGARPPGQQVTFDPISKFRPLALSKPQLADSLAVDLSAFLEAQMSIIVNDTVGPYIGTRVTGTFRAAPLENPWWTTGADVDITGGLKLKILGIEIAEIGGPVFQGPTLFSKTAESPPTAGTHGPDGLPPGPYDPVEGGDVRWAKIHVNTGFPQGGKVVRVPGSAEDVFMMVQSFAVAAPVCRVDARGEVIWSVGANLTAPHKMAATPDGGLIVVSRPASPIITRFSGSGQVLWTSRVRPMEDNGDQRVCNISQILVRPLPDGEMEYFLVGTVNNALVTLDNDPFLMKFNQAGALMWSKRYPSTNMAEGINDALVMHDGNLLFCGSARGNTDGHPIGAGAPEGSLLMKVSPEGDVLWAVRSLPGSWSSVTQSPEGTIFTGGSFLPIVTADIPAILIGSYKPNGEINQIIALCEANPNDKGGSLDPLTSPSGLVRPEFKDWLPDSGFTPYDYAAKILWTPAGLMAAGATGLGEKRAAWHMLFTEKLSARWFAVHEGINVEDVFDMAVTEQGVFALGMTRSFSQPEEQFMPSTLLLKMPFDGTVPLHPSVHSQVKFLQPSIYDFTGGSWDIDIPSPDQGYDKTEPLTFAAAVPLVTIDGDPQFFDYFPQPRYETRRIDKGVPSNPMTYEEWAAYQHLPAGQEPFHNNDGDARTNYEEYLFGGDPWTLQDKVPGLILLRRPEGLVRLQTTRSLAARNQPFAVAGSDDLVDWAVVTNPWTLSNDDAGDIELPPDAGLFYLDVDPQEDLRRFYQMSYPYGDSL